MAKESKGSKGSKKPEEKAKPIFSKGPMKFPDPDVPGNYFTPEALIMFFFAGLLDLIGLILVCFALDDLFILDIAGFLFIGTWMFFRSGSTPSIKGKKKNFQKRLLTAMGAELIPWVGGISPSWIIAVYLELKNNPA